MWDWLRTVGATPGDALEFFVAADPQPLRRGRVRAATAAR